jgi:hypothetical protein
MLLIRAGSRASYKRMDTDAATYTTIAAITDRVQKAVANHYVRELKFYALWTKFTACYPFMGGTAATHKFNLKNPADSDAAFRMVFNGTWTHDANGAAPTPSTAYGDTFVVPGVVNSNINGVSLCIYAHNFGNMVNSSSQEFGSSVSITQRLTLGINAGNTYIFDCYNVNTGQGRINGPNISALGVFAIATRTANNAFAYYTGDMINTNLAPSLLTTVSSGNTFGGSNSTVSILLNAITTSAIASAARTYPFAATMNEGLTAAQARNLYNIVWNAQRDLRRIN